LFFNIPMFFRLLFILVAVAAVVLLIKWFQRCPRCRSVFASLLPNSGYWVKRTCRKCGHTWEERAQIDTLT
jgi:hypothetical protein